MAIVREILVYLGVLPPKKQELPPTYVDREQVRWLEQCKKEEERAKPAGTQECRDQPIGAARRSAKDNYYDGYPSNGYPSNGSPMQSRD